MSLSINTCFPENLPEDFVERMLVRAVDEAAEANAEWYWLEWHAGRLTTEEKCCAGCAGLKYVPDKRAGCIAIDLVPEALRKGTASCQTAVAMSLGHERALLWLDGVSRAEARQMYQPVAQKQGPRYWHLLVRMPDGGIDDPTAEMTEIGAGGRRSAGINGPHKAPGSAPPSCSCTSPRSTP
jgi:hypothetical protein